MLCGKGSLNMWDNIAYGKGSLHIQDNIVWYRVVNILCQYYNIPNLVMDTIIEQPSHLS